MAQNTYFVLDSSERELIGGTAQHRRPLSFVRPFLEIDVGLLLVILGSSKQIFFRVFGSSQKSDFRNLASNFPY